MAVLLTILKWVGIVLLIVIAVLLGFLAYCLLLPMGYGITASHPAGGKYSFSIRAWGFLRFWQVALMEIEGEYQLAVLAFWGKVRLFPRKKQRDDQEDVVPRDVLDEEDIADILEDREVYLEDWPGERQSTPKESSPERDSGITASDMGQKATKQKMKKSKGEKGRGFGNFHKKWKDEHNRNAIQFFPKKILWLLKKTRPNILQADVEFSLGDPALTGLATGIISLCPGCYGKKTRIMPDFVSEDIYANGWIKIKGIVFLVHIVYLIVSIFFNKDCKKLLQS